MAPSEDIPSRPEVDRFIIDTIDSVPHLEALLLLWQNQTQNWSVEGVAKRLWIDPDDTRSILQDLTRNQFLTVATEEAEEYCYRPDSGNDRILRGVAEVYRQEMIRISRMIHAKPSSAVRAFARAFRFTKEQD